MNELSLDYEKATAIGSVELLAALGRNCAGFTLNYIKKTFMVRVKDLNQVPNVVRELIVGAS